jgi:hypothetical protein
MYLPLQSIRAWNQTGLRLLFETIEELEILPIMKNHGVSINQWMEHRDPNV